MSADERSRDDQLRMAHAVAAEAALSGRASGFCKLFKVLLRLAEADPAAPSDLRDCLRDETAEWSEATYDWYLRFVAVVVRGDWVEGQGNYGDEADDCPPAHPKFLECRLTAPGRAAVVSE
jgi:hypothetical protein